MSMYKLLEIRRIQNTILFHAAEEYYYEPELEEYYARCGSEMHSPVRCVS